MGHSQEDASTGDPVIRDLVLITAGVMHDYGIYDQLERFNQLCGSIQSVRDVLPFSDICVIEASRKRMSNDQCEIITELGCEFRQIDLDPTRLAPKELDSNQFAAKILGEIEIWQNFLRNLENRRHHYRRIHKLSGRYRMLPMYAAHIHEAHSVIISGSRSWPKGPDQPNVMDHVYPTRLWSFHTALYWPMRSVWDYVMHRSLEYYKSCNRLPVIEASIHDALHIHGLSCVEVTPIGLEGSFGQDGKFVSE